MEDDDLYRNDGTYFLPREPEEQIIDRKKERAKTLEAINDIKAVIAHFDQRIEERGKISSINVDLTEDPALHQKVFEVNRLLTMALIEERSMLEEMLEIHTKNK